MKISKANARLADATDEFTYNLKNSSVTYTTHKSFLKMLDEQEHVKSVTNNIIKKYSDYTLKDLQISYLADINTGRRFTATTMNLNGSDISAVADTKLNKRYKDIYYIPKK